MPVFIFVVVVFKKNAFAIRREVYYRKIAFATGCESEMTRLSCPIYLNLSGRFTSTRFVGCGSSDKDCRVREAGNVTPINATSQVRWTIGSAAIAQSGLPLGFGTFRCILSVRY